MVDFAVIVSGLPASGKSTLAQLLGKRLGIEVIDKDDVLEEIFPATGEVSVALRTELSRAADVEVRNRAVAASHAIVVSFWQRVELSTAGTPIGWIGQLPNAVEISCECSPETAAERFVERVRHRGHGDRRKTPSEILSQFRALSRLGPLGVGPVVSIDTESPFRAGEIEQLAMRVREAANSVDR